MSLSSLQNETLSIQEKSGSSDGEGGFNFSYSEISTTKGRIYPASPSERVIGGKWDAIVSHSLNVPPGTGIVRDNYILDEAGIYYRVIAQVRPSRVRAGIDHDKYALEEIQVNNDRIVDTP
jgi:hypothetical protein